MGENTHTYTQKHSSFQCIAVRVFVGRGCFGQRSSGTTWTDSTACSTLSTSSTLTRSTRTSWWTSASRTSGQSDSRHACIRTQSTDVSTTSDSADAQFVRHCSGGRVCVCDLVSRRCMCTGNGVTDSQARDHDGSFAACCASCKAAHRERIINKVLSVQCFIDAHHVLVHVHRKIPTSLVDIS